MTMSISVLNYRVYKLQKRQVGRNEWGENTCCVILYQWEYRRKHSRILPRENIPVCFLLFGSWGTLCLLEAPLTRCSMLLHVHQHTDARYQDVCIGQLYQPHLRISGRQGFAQLSQRETERETQYVIEDKTYAPKLQWSFKYVFGYKFRDVFNEAQKRPSVNP